jgi:hypothetical protein
MPKNGRARRAGISRRTFLRYSVGAGALLGAGSVLAAPRSAHGRGPTGASERRTYFFNLSHLDTSAHDLILVAGTQRVKLIRTYPGVVENARSVHPILGYVPDHHISHHAHVAMPLDALQLCYVQRIAQGATDGSWEMVLVFYHHSRAALQEARRRAQRRAGASLPPVHVKWEPYGITPAIQAALNDPVGEETFHDTASQAVALVSGHPELLSLEPNSAADIQTNIIGTQPSTKALGLILTSQGAGWATNTPVIDPTTGQPYRNSHGQNQYVPTWSSTTSLAAGHAVSSALDTVKDDTTLGTDITAVDPTTIIDNDPAAPTNGRVWTRHDGRPTIDQSPTPAPRATTLAYTFADQSRDAGYTVDVTAVGTDDQGNRTVTFTATNSYLRHLGLYVRYLDANGQPIALSTLGSTFLAAAFPVNTLLESSDLNLSGTADGFLTMVNPEWVVLGIPIHSNGTTQTFPLPAQATSALILAGGLGGGDNPYPDTLAPGIILTVLFELCLPVFFLALQAAAGYSRLISQIQDVNILITLLQICVPLFLDLLDAAAFDNPLVFANLAVPIAGRLLSAGAQQLDQMIATAIAEGEAASEVEDAIPVVGLILSAVTSLGLAAQLIETSVEVALSPKTYIGEITFTHDVAVTIAHDPNDPAGFPATAASYTVTAIFDGGTPHAITQAMPGTTVTAPIQVTFNGVPAGGQVSVSVGFYSSNGFLVGQGSVGPVANTATQATLPLAITITELLVPLTADTVYGHKEIIVLDGSGNHQWRATTTPPTVVTPGGQCEDANGQICSLTGITVSTLTSDVGYAWQAYNTAVADCSTGGVGQLHQFANLSFTQSPQSGRLFSGCGFADVVRVVYDLMGKTDRNFYLDPTVNPAVSHGNFIRQIRLTDNPPTYDGPDSNRAWGRLRFSPHAMLLHPQGKIIGLNASAHKLEVLTLTDTAVPDADAPVSRVHSGLGTRPGRMRAPIHAALSPQGTILVLEGGNNRIQAFDLGGNPVPYFAGGAYFVPLHDSGATYLDLDVEYSGYLYVLSYTGAPGAFVYRLDIYDPDGSWLARTTGVNADKLAVSYWRDLFTLNYQVLTLPEGTSPTITEPSVSHWIPSTP